MTHEFHHKGQIAVMLRLLGHTPENTDVLRLT
nr:DinB family protein [Gracilibacillus ureilyticus]